MSIIKKLTSYILCNMPLGGLKKTSLQAQFIYFKSIILFCHDIITFSRVLWGKNSIYSSKLQEEVCIIVSGIDIRERHDFIRTIRQSSDNKIIMCHVSNGWCWFLFLSINQTYEWWPNTDIVFILFYDNEETMAHPFKDTDTKPSGMFFQLNNICQLCRWKNRCLKTII